MNGGLRKAHSKSRNGCGQCKKRRRKCDQVAPRCGNCQKWGTVCDFTALSAAVQLIMENTFAQNTQFEAALVPPLPFPTLDPRAGRLLHHYATQTSLTLSAQDTLPVWQISVPGEAKTHLFLMHSLLALTALHVSHVDARQRNKYLNVANMEHEQAMLSFRESVQEVNIENGTAVTAFSFLTVVYSIGVPVIFDFAGTSSPTKTFIDILKVLRRAWTAVECVLPSIETGSLGRVIKPPPRTVESCPMHFRGRQALKFLERYNEASKICDEHKSIYRKALSELSDFFNNIRDTPPTWDNALRWPMCVSPEFFQLLQEKKPFALILLAHWCVPVWRAPNMWFNKWAKHIVSDIWNTLTGKAKDILLFPAEQTGIIPRDMHRKPCLCLQCCHEIPVWYWKETATALLVDDGPHSTAFYL